MNIYIPINLRALDRKKKYDSRTHQGFGKLQGMVKSCKNYRPPASVKQMQKKEKKLSQSVKIWWLEATKLAWRLKNGYAARFFNIWCEDLSAQKKLRYGSVLSISKKEVNL